MGLGQRLLGLLWYVHPPTGLMVQSQPAECIKALADAAKPSQRRLEFRNLFTEGRRYYLQPQPGGFRLTSNSKIPWRRGRTTVAAVLDGAFHQAGADATHISLRARMRAVYFLDIFFVPSFITSIMVFTPWPGGLIAALAAALYGLSWAWHRLAAAMQAAEMVYFVQKALEDLTPYQAPALGAASADVVTLEFRTEWEKFYHQRQSNGSAE